MNVFLHGSARHRDYAMMRGVFAPDIAAHPSMEIKMRTLLTIIMLAALVAVSSAGAAERPAAHLLQAESSSPGESLDAFVTRIAAGALAASREQRAIACGEVTGTGPFTVQLKTDGDGARCVVPKSAAPYLLVNGIAKDARENHFPLAHRFQPGYLITPWSIKFQDRNGVRKVGDIER
ncbi:hypothetical protein [Xanthomonas campestris]|uniref:hypothetical protein n=1 Tax=Xanthomonas campestris TaxID=339 RepID=UPI001F35D810|nr:hypothetical protein [Xanthomonas campestris]MCF8799264.1 hypothetical protein [Xanthomonas campestris pv. campestris]MCF8813794.1 hypothetical protein [Xanthomonas campestris pv. campestris]WHO87388.1 hypothetical protein QMY63_14890 [Xanthomonas campestris]